MKVLDPNDPVQRAEIHKRNDRRLWWEYIAWPVILTVVLIIVCTVGDLVGNQIWYGDWRCAFVNCVRVQDIKNPRAKP